MMRSKLVRIIPNLRLVGIEAKNMGLHSVDRQPVWNIVKTYSKAEAATVKAAALAAKAST